MPAREAVTVLAVVLGLQVASVLACRLLERRAGAAAGDLRRNLAYLLPLNLLHALLLPLAGAAAALAVDAAGGGWLAFPQTAAGACLSVACYVLAMDGAEYVFHRAQHRLPVLWAMHSLHHSDASLNASTTPRHFWAERLVKTVTVYAAVGMLLKVDAVALGVYAGLGLYNYVLHMDVRVGFGRWAAWLNSPQFHRLHHSRLAQHHDCNFAALFPVFDVLGGTFRRPAPAEYPPTGLDTGDAPRDLGEMLVWPWRRREPAAGHGAALPSGER